MAPNRPIYLPHGTGGEAVALSFILAARPRLSYRSTFIDPVLFVRWEATTEAADFDRLVAEVRRVRASLERRVVCVALVSPVSGVPDALARNRIASAMDEVWEHCASIHVVMEGGGMRRAILRSVIAGLLLVVMRRGRPFTVHPSAQHALDSAKMTTLLHPAQVLAGAVRDGILPNDRPQSTGT